MVGSESLTGLVWGMRGTGSGTAIGLGQSYTINPDAWQPAGEPGLDLGPQVIQETGPLGGLGRGGGQGQEDGEDQRTDCRTVGQT
jgi:hypothetical protein